MPKKNRYNKKNIRQGLLLFQNAAEKLGMSPEQRKEAAKKLKDQRESLQTKTEELVDKFGDLAENALGKRIENSSLEAPILEPGAVSEPKTWYRVPVPEGISGDGSEYHIYVKRGTTDNLCIFFSGGGVAWNEYTAARPVTGGKTLTWKPNYYWNNLRPFTQIMNINVGITETNTARNPFDDWNFIVITYATGDFHAGTGDFNYTAEDGTKQVLHFHGRTNFIASLDLVSPLFPKPAKLLIAGDSAGAFSVPQATPCILERYYPDCRNITLLSDSAMLEYGNWRHTAKDIWKSPEKLWRAIHTTNIALDWYEELFKEYGTERFKCLYATSTHDYLLSAFYNDVTNKTYHTDAEVQEAYYEQTKEMVQRLKELNPDFHFFINNWKNVLYTKGGTIHTVVRQPYFWLKNEGVSMAAWLHDAVHGNLYNVGTDLLEQ